jgi:hypothetical protein
MIFSPLNVSKLKLTNILRVKIEDIRLCCSHHTTTTYKTNKQELFPLMKKPDIALKLTTLNGAVFKRAKLTNMNTLYGAK